MVGGNDVFRREMRCLAEMTSFVRLYMRGARFFVFFPSSNKLDGFHIYNTLVSQISIEILGYFHQLSPFPSRLRTAIYRTAVIGCLEARGGDEDITEKHKDSGLEKFALIW